MRRLNPPTWQREFKFAIKGNTRAVPPREGLIPNAVLPGSNEETRPDAESMSIRDPFDKKPPSPTKSRQRRPSSRERNASKTIDAAFAIKRMKKLTRDCNCNSSCGSRIVFDLKKMLKFIYGFGLELSYITFN